MCRTTRVVCRCVCVCVPPPIPYRSQITATVPTQESLTRTFPDDQQPLALSLPEHSFTLLPSPVKSFTHLYTSKMPPTAPPLTEEARQQLAERREAEHAAFIRSIATSRSLPRLRSTIAGAGGKTNEQARLAEEHEAERLQRLKREAEAAAALTGSTAHHEAHKVKVAALQAAQNRKRHRRQAKKAKQKRQRSESRSHPTSPLSESDSDDSD